MVASIRNALINFTECYSALWQQQQGHLPASEPLYGIPSPCIVDSAEGRVYWRPVTFAPSASLQAVERALGITLCPEIHVFYTTQYAGDMDADFAGHSLTLLQAWSEADFIRLQENLIGHLLTQKRLKLSPTLFIATTDDDMQIISLCNNSKSVVLEQVGTAHREVLADTLVQFLTGLRV